MNTLKREARQSIDKINWRITYKCNMTPFCNYCFAPHEEKTDENKISSIAIKIKELKPKMVVISGGEPTTISILPQIVDLFNRENIKVCLATNGIDLLKILPEFCSTLDTITLPLDNISSGRSIRNELCVQSVHNILKMLTEIRSKGGKTPKTIINTVLNDTNLSNINDLAQFLSFYDIDVWKIFEYIHMEGNNLPKKVCKLLDHQLNYLRKTLSINLSYEDAENKDSRYFMVNPNGDIVIPKRVSGNTFQDIHIGSIFASTDTYFERWKTMICSERYNNSNALLKV